MISMIKRALDTGKITQKEADILTKKVDELEKLEAQIWADDIMTKDEHNKFQQAKISLRQELKKLFSKNKIKKMRKTFNILLIFCLFTIMANSQEVSSDVYNVCKKDTLIISIVDNPSTGYSWRFDESQKVKNLKYLGDSFTPNEQGLIGAAGTRHFKFLAKKVGNVKLKFYKIRGNQQPIETKEYSVEVKKKKQSSEN